MTEPQPASRREVLAFIALQDLPVPAAVRFHPDREILILNLDSVADGQVWSRSFGGSTRTYVNKTDGRTYLDEGVIKWRGYSVQLMASDDHAPDTELDEDTTAALREIAEPDEGDAS